MDDCLASWDWHIMTAVGAGRLQPMRLSSILALLAASPRSTESPNFGTVASIMGRHPNRGEVSDLCGLAGSKHRTKPRLYGG